MNFKNILVFKIGHLGDTLVALPAFWAIRNNYPDAKLTLLANINQGQNLITALDVLPEQGLFDDRIIYPSTALSVSSISEYIKLLLKLRREKFDCLIYLMTRNRSVRQIKRDRFYFSLSGIKTAIGMNYLSQNLLSYQTSRPLQKVESESNFLINCLREDEFFKFSDERIISELNLTNEENQYADRWIKTSCPSNKNQKLVAVAPGSKWESKMWGIEKYSEVIQRLIRENDVFPIVFGGREDLEIGTRMISEWGRGVNAAGLLSVRQSAAVLKRCVFYLGNDTGTMHLAAAAGIKCVAVFSAVDYPERWLPAGSGHKIFRQTVECEGCHSSLCINNSLCMTLTSVNAVYEACQEVFSVS